jgi:hypothetical protein
MFKCWPRRERNDLNLHLDAGTKVTLVNYLVLVSSLLVFAMNSMHLPVGSCFVNTVYRSSYRIDSTL